MQLKDLSAEQACSLSRSYLEELAKAGVEWMTPEQQAVAIGLAQWSYLLNEYEQTKTNAEKSITLQYLSQEAESTDWGKRVNEWLAQQNLD